MRRRREIGRWTLAVLSPFFRYSETRTAWVLRVVGRKHGPVLVRKAGRSANRLAKPS